MEKEISIEMRKNLVEKMADALGIDPSSIKVAE